MQVNAGRKVVVTSCCVAVSRKLSFATPQQTPHHTTTNARISVLQECGVTLEDFDDFQQGDVVQCYTLDEIKRTL